MRVLCEITSNVLSFEIILIIFNISETLFSSTAAIGSSIKTILAFLKYVRNSIISCLFPPLINDESTPTCVCIPFGNLSNILVFNDLSIFLTS